jgi:hypothetical protein
MGEAVMPRIEMRDAFGTSYRIDTSSDQTLQAWFGEWLPLLFPADLDIDYGQPLILRAEPLFDKENHPDWPPWMPYMHDPFHIPRDPAEALPALKRRREFIEKDAATKGYR